MTFHNIHHLTARLVRWVADTFGETNAMDRHERGLRLMEEAMEVAQADGVSNFEATLLAARVWSRPVGNCRREIAGTFLCLLAAAHAHGSDLLDLAEKEMAWLEERDKSECRRKQNEKSLAGLGRPYEQKEV